MMIFQCMLVVSDKLKKRFSRTLHFPEDARLFSWKLYPAMQNRTLWQLQRLVNQQYWYFCGQFVAVSNFSVPMQHYKWGVFCILLWWWKIMKAFSRLGTLGLNFCNLWKNGYDLILIIPSGILLWSRFKVPAWKTWFVQDAPSSNLV